MIVLIHKKNKIVQILNKDTLESIEFSNRQPIIKVLYHIAEIFPNKILVWCHQLHEKVINFKIIEETLALKNGICSFSKKQYLPDAIGYVEQSPFINVNKTVKYPTWLMSSEVGAIHASQLIKFKDVVKDRDFDYALNSIAKLGIPNGLFCYSEPKLLKTNFSSQVENKSISILFKFVKQHYKLQWVFLLALNYFWHEKRSVFWALIKSFVYKRNFFDESILPVPIIKEGLKDEPSIDVIIPTIGRKQFLYDVLQDLKSQTVLPKRVIIVEQNPLSGSNSELNYLTTEFWPFIIDHTFIHQTGACNARNIALSKVKSEWVFFADDDIRIKNEFFKILFSNLNKYKVEACVLSCLLENQKQSFTEFHQTGLFGSGCSVVKSIFAKKINFNEKLEFGFGEDFLYGLELRNIGIDVIYFSKPTIIHLKAPIGGFRTKFKHPWDYEILQPKPSPTIMYVNLKYKTTEQLMGSKVLLFLRMFISVKLSKKIIFYKEFNNRWRVSKYWAKQL